MLGIKLAKHLIVSNDPCQNKFNHASAKSLPIYIRTRVLYGKLRVEWTCVQSDICRFRTRRFSISKLAVENKYFYRGLLIKSVRTSNEISVLSFARAKSILCACPTVGSVPEDRWYISHLNPLSDDFWQRPKSSVKGGEKVWFNNVPVGKNTLG